MSLDSSPEEDAHFVDWVRSTAQRRMDATSLRAVARQVGMSPSGLSKFLAGARPYSKTLARLRAWYLWQSEQPATLSPQETLAALQLLTSPLPVDRRPDAAAGIMDALRGCFGGKAPAWWAEFERLAQETMVQTAHTSRRGSRRKVEDEPVHDWAGAGLM
jgi:lambda repressor-like predicted transcriptional regulator